MVERASPLWRPRHRQSVERPGLAHSLRHGDIVPISQEGAELIATMTTTASRPTLMGTATDDPLSLLAKEWLVTNGIGICVEFALGGDTPLSWPVRPGSA